MHDCSNSSALIVEFLELSRLHSGKAYEGTCRIPRQNGDGRGIASAKFVWIVKAIESAARPHVVCGY